MRRSPFNGFRLLGCRHLQHPLVELGFDLAIVDHIWETQRALKSAEAALCHMVVLALLLLLQLFSPLIVRTPLVSVTEMSFSSTPGSSTSMVMKSVPSRTSSSGSKSAVRPSRPNRLGKAHDVTALRSRPSSTGCRYKARALKKLKAGGRASRRIQVEKSKRSSCARWSSCSSAKQ